jgi:hypothetical protein
MARKLTILIQADGTTAKAALKDVDNAVNTVTDSVKGQEAAMKAALGIFTNQAIRTFVSDLKSAATEFITAFSEQEKATKALTVALQAQGTYTPELASQYDALATHFERTTTFSDELINSMEALLVQVGNVAPQQMQAALTAATNLSAGLGIDLRTATLLVGKAFEGETQTLSRYGIVIDEAKLKSEGVTAVLDSINQKFGGQAQGQIQTYSGHVQQLSNDLNNVQESAGHFITSGLNPLFDGFSHLEGPVQATALAFVAVGTAIAPAALSFLTLAPALKVIWPSLVGVGSALGALAPAAAVVGTAFAAWEFGRWIDGFTGLSNIVETWAAKLYGASDAEIAAARYAREYKSTIDDMAGPLEKATAAVSALWAAAMPKQATPLAMTESEISAAEKDLTESADKSIEAHKKLEAAFGELRTAGQGWQGTLATMDGETVRAIQAYLEAGVSQETLAIAYGKTATQIKSVSMFMVDQVRQQRINDQAIQVTTQLWDEYDAQRVAQGGTATDVQIADIERWKNNLIATMKAAKADTEDFYAALAAVSKAKTDSILVDWDSIGQNSRAALQQAADKAQATFQYMLDHADQFTTETIEKFWHLSEEAQKAADAWGTGFEDAATKAGAAIEQTAQKATVTWETAMDAVGKGLGTMAGVIQGLPGNTPGGQTRYDDYGHPYIYVPGKNAPGHPTPPGASTVPGFANGVSNFSGGMAMVGERGPELVRLPKGSDVIPNRSVGSPSVTVHIDARESFFDSAAGVKRLADKVTQSIVRQRMAYGAAMP